MADLKAGLVLTAEKRVAKILVVCGGQRNGSTALLEGLELSGSLLNCGEIFNPLGVEHGQDAYRLRLKPELNYFNFLQERKTLSVPTAFEQKSRFQDYIRHLESAAHTRWIGLNVKFNGWHNLDAATQEIGQPPNAVRLFGSSDATFLLVGRDVVAQSLSEYLAHESGAWHLATSQVRSEFKRKIEVDTRRLIGRARLLNRQTSVLQKWLGHHRLLTMAYEEVFEGESFSPLALRMLSTELGIPSHSLTQALPLVRVSPTHYDWIENRAELLEALTSSSIAFDEGIARALAAT